MSQWSGGVPRYPEGIDGSRHRRPRRGIGRAILAAVVTLLLIAAGAGFVWWRYGGSIVGRRPVSQPAFVSPCPDAQLKVIAAPEIAPVVQAAARTLNPGGTDCGTIGVAAAEPDVVAASGGPRPDVWIPSSSAWLQVAAMDGGVYAATGAPLARTPIVLAAPTAIAGLFARGNQTSWGALVAGAAGHRIPAVTMPDPLHSTVGLLSVYAVNQAMARTTPDGGIAQLRALTLRSRLKDAAADPVALLEKLGDRTDATQAVYDVGVFPITEQQLTAYQHAGHAVRLTEAFPVDGLVEADYPFAVAAGSKSAALAGRLRAAIGQAALTRAGFRTSAEPHAMPLPAKPDALLGPALQWSQYRNLSFQVLLLVDASGSMNDRIRDKAGRTTTKAALLRQSGLSANQLFGEDTSIGMWFFATALPSSPAHVEAVPVGPITAAVAGKPRRDVMAGRMTSYRATFEAGTPLYQTVLDGEAAMRARARKGTVTLVVVLTDGDDRASRFAMTNAAFMQRLAAQQDPARPVPIIAVGYGPDADMTALTRMAAATGGKAIAARNPADVASAIAKAFLAAHAPT